MKKSQRIARVFPKVTYEPDYDHPHWNEEGPAPTPQTAPEAFYVTREYAPTPQERRVLARRPKYQSLSRTRLRKRLYAAGLRGPVLAKAVAQVRSGPYAKGSELPEGFNSAGLQALGWPVSGLKEVFGKRATRAMLKHVRTYWVFLDELGYYMPSGIGGLAIACRSLNAQPVLVTQDLSDFKKATGIDASVFAPPVHVETAERCAALQ